MENLSTERSFITTYNPDHKFIELKLYKVCPTHVVFGPGVIMYPTDKIEFEMRVSAMRISLQFLRGFTIRYFFTTCFMMFL